METPSSSSSVTNKHCYESQSRTTLAGSVTWRPSHFDAGTSPVAFAAPTLTPSNSPYSSAIPLYLRGHPYGDIRDRAPFRHRPIFVEPDLLADGDRAFAMFGMLDADGGEQVVHRPLRFRLGPGHLLLDAIEERFDIHTFLTVIDLE